MKTTEAIFKEAHRTGKAAPKKPVCFLLEAEEKSRFDNLAKQRGLTPSAVLQAAVKRILKDTSK